MELYERIKILRKKHLNLSRDAFASRLGVSRDVIANIELNRLARPEQKLSLIKLICKEFNVREDWLLNGKLPIFESEETFSLSDFAKDHQISELEFKILKAYFELDPAIREYALRHFQERLRSTSEAIDISDKEQAYIKSRLSSAPTTNVSVLNFTEEEKKHGIN